MDNTIEKEIPLMFYPTFEGRVLFHRFDVAVIAAMLMLLTSSACYAADTESSDSILRKIIEPTEREDVIQDITRSVRGLNPIAKVLACGKMFSYVRENTGGRDSSFAATCTFDFNGQPSKQYTTNVCDDRLIGKFTLGGGNGLSLANSDEEWKRYIEINCPPGG